MGGRATLDEVLEHHLGSGGLLPHARDQLRRLVAMAAGAAGSAEDEATALAQPLRLSSPSAVQEVAALVGPARAAGLTLEHSLPIAQAYVRAVGRIVEAEVEHVQRVLRGVPEERRIAELDRLLPELMTAVGRGFDLVHRTSLRSALNHALAASQSSGAIRERVVALIDLSGSTQYLVEASEAETEALVDGLFQAGQAVASEHRVTVVKYVGDGFFLSGRDPEEVVRAAAGAVRHIGALLPLPARAGVARGRVISRAGDLFGLPVNVAQLLTKRADRHAVLVTASVARDLPASVRGAARKIDGVVADEPITAVDVATHCLHGDAAQSDDPTSPADAG